MYLSKKLHLSKKIHGKCIKRWSRLAALLSTTENTMRGTLVKGSTFAYSAVKMG